MDLITQKSEIEILVSRNALLLPIRMIVRPWLYRLRIQSYEQLNFTVVEGSAINNLDINITFLHNIL